MRIILCLAALVALPFNALHAQTTPADLELTEVVTGLSSPVGARHAGDGSGRLFIIERCGTIRLVKNGALEPTPFVTVAGPCGFERGLLGLAFHPDYDGVSERRFYVAYTLSSGSGASEDQGIAEFQTTVGNPDVADVSTRREIISVPDIAGNHNGGDIAFGPDGMLYWSMGDGGPQNDPNEFAQNLWRKTVSGNEYYLLGKIIRIDPTQNTASATAEMCASTAGQPANYAIPPDNPFLGSSNTCDEIGHYGMRNPFRISFDSETGQLFVADVGQGAWEEVSVIEPGDLGRNLGWRCFEAQNPNSGSGACNPTPANILQPITSYQHLSGRCSISGGYRYRGPITIFRGTYIYADFCTGEIMFTIDSGGGNWTPGQNALNVWFNAPYSIAGFGEDEDGNVYVLDFSGRLLRFDSKSASDFVFNNGFE